MRALLLVLSIGLGGCAALSPTTCPDGSQPTSWCGCDTPIIPPSPDGTDPGDC
jgi:hypothetical protein